MENYDGYSWDLIYDFGGLKNTCGLFRSLAKGV
jgi:hypothetical protein